MKGFFILLLLSNCSYISLSNPVEDYGDEYDEYYLDYNETIDDYADYYPDEVENVEGISVNDCECEDDIFETDCNCGARHGGAAEPFECINEIDSSVFDNTFQVCKTEGGTCEDFKKNGFDCVPTFNCNGTIITDGEGLIDIKSPGFKIPGECMEPEGTLDATDRKCPNEGHICCKNPDFSKIPDKKPQREPCIEEPHYSECGRSLETGLKINGGDFDKKKFAQPGEFPHMCIIYKEVFGTREYVGGASLIARNLLLTVAHKFWLNKKGQENINDFNNPEKFFVRCGEHNVRNKADLFSSQETSVRKIHIHPDYLPRRVKNNMAIIETVNNFVYQKHVGRVCLPGVDSSVYEGKTECWSSGWGADTYSSSDNTKYSDNLKKIKMPVVDLRTCQNKLRQHPRLKSTFKVHKSWLCVGGEAGVDTCSGDGGSPHVCKGDKGQFVQVGAVNWGLGCGDAVPSVYSSVPDAMCWIDKVMSCVSDSKNDIELYEDYDRDIRGTFQDLKIVESANKLSTADCAAWKADTNHDGVLDNCKVNYGAAEQIDERIVDEDTGRGR